MISLPRGIALVALQEFRMRLRTGRWRVLLGVWLFVLGGFTLLLDLALNNGTSGAESNLRGVPLLGILMLFVLACVLIISPTLTSQTINGDRERGTLATLQVTLLSPSEIAAGKLLAAWLSACAFLVVSLPFLALALALGGTPVMSLVRVVLIIAVLLAAICGIGLGYSALSSRSAGSTVLTFLTVAALTLLTPILFATTYPSISHEETLEVYTAVPTADGDYTCDYVTATRSVAHTERTWWLLGINPFVILADGAEAAPTSPYVLDEPLAGIRTGVRQLRAGPAGQLNECWVDDSVTSQEALDDISATPFWFWGLGANVLLGAAGFAVAVRRLRIPQTKLARGTRVRAGDDDITLFKCVGVAFEDLAVAAAASRAADG